MENPIFSPADILLPDEAALPKWSVVACDQYTSEPAYWEETDRIVGGAPSALRVMLPEIDLDRPDVADRIASVNATMQRYLAQGVFRKAADSMIYVERTLANGSTRRGLVGAVDLEAYDYRKGSQSPVRATEGTVLSRIPPRVRVREHAALEMPHIMLLIDDPEKTVIEPLTGEKPRFSPLYDFDLMQGGGHISGWRADGAAVKRVGEALGALAEPAAFNRKYGVSGKGVLLFAVGDGNHSLATAKECFERIKEQLPEAEWRRHPARRALVEVVNLRDASLVFEPIHRVVFGVNPQELLAALGRYYQVELGEGPGQSFGFVAKHARGRLRVMNPKSNLAVGTLQAFLDDYLAENGGRVDYIHGGEVVESLGRQDANIGFLLPPMPKSELFRTVILDGALPRKTFSMGHACDKRYYLECRRL